MQKDREPVEPLDDPHKELIRLWRENEILRQERALLKKGDRPLTVRLLRSNHQEVSSRLSQNDDLCLH